MGKHHLPPRALTRTVAATAAAGVMAVFCYGSVASAAPGDAPDSQGTVTDTPPSTQGALTGDAPTSQGDLTVAPTPAPQQRTYWVAPPPQYDTVQWDSFDSRYPSSTTGTSTEGADTIVDTTPDAPVAPLDVSTLHAPIPVDPTPPVEAREDEVAIGRFTSRTPNWMSDNVRDRTNNSTAVATAQVTDFWRSIGVPTDRAQRLAASQIALGAAGAVTGAVTAGTVAAVTGAAAVGTVAGIGGAAVGQVFPAPPPLNYVTSGVVATAAGAGVGAIGAGVPAAAIGGAAGLAGGLIAGTVYGAGDLGGEERIDIPEIDPAAVTAQTDQTIAAVQGVPGGAGAVDAWTPPVTPADELRTAVTAQPGGEQVVAAIDRAIADVHASDLGPAVDVIGGAIAAAFAPA